MRTFIIFKFLIILFIPICVSADQLVENGKYVTIHYSVSLDSGEQVITTTRGSPLGYIHGTRTLVLGLEQNLSGMKIGQTKKFRLTPKQAYGQRDPQKVAEVPKDILTGNLVVGEEVQGVRATGETIKARVIEVKDHTAVLDFNHPLAGHSLEYTVKVISISDSAAS